MLSDSTPLRVTAGQPGTATRALTARVYVHVVPEAQGGAARALELEPQGECVRSRTPCHASERRMALYATAAGGEHPWCPFQGAGSPRPRRDPRMVHSRVDR